MLPGHGGTLDWLEISVEVDYEAAEAVSEVLSRYIPQGVAIDPGGEIPSQHVTVRAYLKVDDELAPKRRQIEEGLWHLGQIWPVPEPGYRTIADQDWAAGWKERIPVLHLGPRLVIKPTWKTYEPTPQEIVLELDPGMSFGTGVHPSTQLCITALEQHVQPGMRILDLGTGTGILALAAAKLAEVEILAVDNDVNAVAVARRNARRNQVLHAIRLLHGSLPDVSGTYDLILANLLTPIIVRMAQAGLATRLRVGGQLIAAGILEEQAAEVTTALEQAGLQVTAVLHQEEWVALIAEKHITLPPAHG